jgi:ribosomal protein S18 acetylase RimI-like enzyme
MPDETSVRVAQPKDAGCLIDFNKRNAFETEGKHLDHDILTSGVNEILSNPDRGFYLVAEIDRQVVGCLMITTEWSDWRNGAFWWIQSVYVASEFRRRGVFRALHEAARERAQKADRVCGFRLYVERENDAAQATYTGLGLTETSYKMFEKLFT